MDIRIDPEFVYRDRLAKFVGGHTEVSLDCGRIDVLTDTHVYEVKHIRLWKQAMGQALVYASELNLIPAVAVFGAESDSKQMYSLIQAAMSLEVDVVYFQAETVPIVLIRHNHTDDNPIAIPKPAPDGHGHIWVQPVLLEYKEAQSYLGLLIQQQYAAARKLETWADYMSARWQDEPPYPTIAYPDDQPMWWMIDHLDMEAS